MILLLKILYIILCVPYLNLINCQNSSTTRKISDTPGVSLGPIVIPTAEQKNGSSATESSTFTNALAENVTVISPNTGSSLITTVSSNTNKSEVEKEPSDEDVSAVLNILSVANISLNRSATEIKATESNLTESDETLPEANSKPKKRRYGIQKNAPCKDFKKTYICTRKCLDTGFDKGILDKNCRCSCSKTKDKGSFTTPRKKNLTKWTSGAPTTVKPYWAYPKTTTEIIEDGHKYGAFRCDYTYDAVGQGWFKIHQLGNWTIANTTCTWEGAELVAPRSKGVKEAVLTMIRKDVISSIHTARVPMGNDTQNSSLSIILDRNGLYHTVSRTDWYPFICYKKGEDLMELSECGTVDSEYQWSNTTGHCYKFHDTLATWCQALRICVAEGGYLAIINSYSEHEGLTRLFADKWQAFYERSEDQFCARHAHVGFWTLDLGRTWTTLEGQTISEAGYDVWYNGDPTNSLNNEFCGKLEKDLMVFIDDPCNRVSPFICEKGTLPSDICDNPIPKHKLDGALHKCVKDYDAHCDLFDEHDHINDAHKHGEEFPK